MLDVHRLRLLSEFAARGSIAKAAAALGYTPSAVSQQLATLEREAGTALLDRTARRASLTDAGRARRAHPGAGRGGRGGPVRPCHRGKRAGGGDRVSVRRRGVRAGPDPEL